MQGRPRPDSRKTQGFRVVPAKRRFGIRYFALLAGRHPASPRFAACQAEEHGRLADPRHRRLRLRRRRARPATARATATPCAASPARASARQRPRALDDSCSATRRPAPAWTRALDGVDVAYYLIHSMEGAADGAFADLERRQAETFAAAAPTPRRAADRLPRRAAARGRRHCRATSPRGWRSSRRCWPRRRSRSRCAPRS